VAQGSPARVNIPATTAADQTNDPEHPRRRWASVNSTGRDSTKLSTP
jgi:hypothetical protein